MTAATDRPKVGIGIASGHHGELLQGAFHHQGAIVRGLVTLPCAHARSAARFVTSDEPVVVAPPNREKAARAAQLTLRQLRVREGGTLTLSNTIPEELGLGSSTADVVATVRAVAAAYGTTLSPAHIGRLAVAAELASDSIMFDGPVLFAQRDGMILEDFCTRWPPLVVVGAIVDTGVDTLAFPPAEYSEFELHRFDELRRQLRRALWQGDAVGIASVATASARINQRHLPLAAYEQLEWIADRTGAVGLQVAHSGAVAGLLYDPAIPTAPSQVELGRRHLEQAGYPGIRVFGMGRLEEAEAAEDLEALGEGHV